MKHTVDSTKHVDGSLDNLLSLLGRADGSNSPRSQRLDFLHDLLRRLAAEVVDNDIGSELGVHERVGATESSSSTSDNDRLVVETNGLGLLVGGESLRLLEVREVVCVGDVGRVGRLGEVVDLLPAGFDLCVPRNG